MLPLLLNLGKNVPAANNVGVIDPGDSRFYIVSKEDNIFMIQADDKFPKNDLRPDSFHVNSFQKPATALLDEPHDRNSEQGE